MLAPLLHGKRSADAWPETGDSTRFLNLPGRRGRPPSPHGGHYCDDFGQIVKV